MRPFDGGNQTVACSNASTVQFESMFEMLSHADLRTTITPIRFLAEPCAHEYLPSRKAGHDKWCSKCGEYA